MATLLNIRLGHECNHQCRFCTVYGTDEPTPSTEEVKELIRNSDAKVIAFTGGEPTIRPDLPELIKFTGSLGKKVEIQTNLSNITDEIFQALNSVTVNHIMGSLHSHKREIHKYITGVDDFDKVLKNLKKLVDAGFRVSVSQVINETNYKDLLDFVKFILENVGKVKFYFSFIRPNGRTQQNLHLVPRLYKVQYHLYKVLTYLKKRGDILFEVEGVPLCYMLEFKEYSSEYIRSTNRYYQAQEYTNFKGERYKAVKRCFESTKASSSDCEICKMNIYCPGIWKEYAELYGLKELFPVFKDLKTK